MAGRKKSRVNVNIADNRLVITFAEKITKKMLSDLYTDIRFSVADLKPGFNVISNFLDADVIVLNSIPTFQKISHFLASSGAAHIIRVMDTSRLAETQLGNLINRVQGYHPVVVSSLEEAEEKIEVYQKRDGIRIYLHHTPVKYVSGEQEGDGDILNISTSGIAVDHASFIPEIDSAIQFSLSFDGQGEEKELFELEATTVRRDGDSFFAARFNEIDEETKKRLWKVLLDEALQEMM